MNYYIKGDPTRAEEIKAAFEKLGCKNIHDFKFKNEYHLYFSCNGEVNNCGNNGCIASIIKTHPDYKELELPIEPCFKVGDKIQAAFYGIKRRMTIREVDKTNRCYFGTLGECIGFSEQDKWHLAPKPHYDISNFKSFQKVLVRQDDSCTWGISFFGCYSGMFMCCSNVCYEQCIPFNEETKHLLGTTDMPDEMYINW